MLSSTDGACAATRNRFGVAPSIFSTAPRSSRVLPWVSAGFTAAIRDDMVLVSFWAFITQHPRCVVGRMKQLCKNREQYSIMRNNGSTGRMADLRHGRRVEELHAGGELPRAVAAGRDARCGRPRIAARFQAPRPHDTLGFP